MKRMIIVTAAILLVVIPTLSGCASMRAGNEDSDVEAAIKETGERYGVELKLKKKARYPGGVKCDVTTTCEELPGKEIRVFKSLPNERVASDYIYQKYGDEAYERIMEALRPVVPDAKIVPTEFNYNQFAFQDYDADTTLEDYLRDNDFAIYVYIEGEGSRGELRMVFNNCAKALLDAGIDCKELDIFSCSRSSFDSIKEYPYIPELMEYKGPLLDKINGEAKSSDSEGLSESMEALDYDGNVFIMIK